MSRLRLSSGLLFLFVPLTGCRPASTPEAAFAVRDSAGIEILESSATLPGPDAWTISEEPALQIGGVEGDDPYLLTGLLAAGNHGKILRMDDGRIVVCNGFDRTIRFFDEEGAFLFQVGGQGEGPSEFDGIRDCSPDGEGFVVLGTRGKAAWFDGQGELLRTVSIAEIDGRRTELEDVFSDGSVLVSRIEPLTDRPGLTIRTSELFLSSPDGASVEELLTVNEYAISSDGDSGGIQQFGPYGQVLVAGNEVLYAWPEDYEIGVYGQTGQIQRLVRKLWDPIPVTDADIEWWRSFRFEARDLSGRVTNERTRQLLIGQMDAMIYPDHHAAFDKMMTDRAGYLWVRRQHSRMAEEYRIRWVTFPYERTWDLFDPAGRWVTTLTMPVAFEIHDIGEDYILGVWQDEMDVEYVRMYSLDRVG